MHYKCSPKRLGEGWVQLGGLRRTEKGGRAGRRLFSLHHWVKIHKDCGSAFFCHPMSAAKDRTKYKDRALHFRCGIKCLCESGAMGDLQESTQRHIHTYT